MSWHLNLGPILISILVLSASPKLSQAEDSCILKVWPSGEAQVSHKFEYTQEEKDTEVWVYGGEGCHLRVFAVGGGGTGGCNCPTGGGSGFIQYVELPIPSNDYVYGVRLLVGKGS